MDQAAAQLRHSVARWAPGVIQPKPRQLTIAVTADCNLRCKGCRYGRDFMAGERLSFETIRSVLDDAREAGIDRVRFYGGEPLLHPELPAMVRHSIALGLRPYVTTNGTHLGPKIPALFDAGLRLATIGFYGIGQRYDDYTRRRGHFERLERSLSEVRSRYGKAFELQLNFVLIRETCNLADLELAWSFARKYDMFFHIDLANYAAPFFVQDREADLQLQPDDRPRVEAVTRALLALKRSEPERFLHSVEFIRSVPDWLLKGPDMRVPCDAYELLWIGADGTLQLCDVALPLGNVNIHRMRDLLFTEAHAQAARDGFKLNCPNCTCKAQTRIQKDVPSMRRYGRMLAGEATQA
ncbi:radical SAM protein [Sabulicella rubraurantiaca]|uniref:radical SAM protein n=1 Tax=Sabulicella rubraurantiaca TaxID=2811429 RepID=UPI001A9776AB|nr:radical SAM protein [Sabulicella rubraurantiaca]